MKQMDDKAIREELKELQLKIKELKNNFSKKRDHKEDNFLKGEEYSKEITKLYAEVEEIEKEHNLDKINQDLEKKIKEKEEFQEELKKIELQFKNLEKTKVDYSKPKVKTVSSEKLTQELKSLEHKLQTQVLSLSKESEYVKKVEEIKNSLKVFSAPGSTQNDGSFNSVKKTLIKAKRKLENVDKKIRSFYKQIRLINKEKKKKYKQIDELRLKKKEAFDTFRTSKKDYSQVGKELKDLFTQEEQLLTKLGESSPEKKHFNKDIKKKQKEIEDNFLKKGKTLTTEDLLMLQAKK